jgi:transposase InsO family protein
MGVIARSRRSASTLCRFALSSATMASTVRRIIRVSPLALAFTRLRRRSDCAIGFPPNLLPLAPAVEQLRVSMSRRGNPWDNASCESFMKTLKCEEVYRSEYRNLAEARARIGDFLEEIYNQKRLHSSLGYCPPAEFERRQPSPVLAVVAQEVV